MTLRNTTSSVLRNWSFNLKINAVTLTFYDFVSTSDGSGGFNLRGMSWITDLLAGATFNADFAYTGANLSTLTFSVAQISGGPVVQAVETASGKVSSNTSSSSSTNSSSNTSTNTSNNTSNTSTNTSTNTSNNTSTTSTTNSTNTSTNTSNTTSTVAVPTTANPAPTPVPVNASKRVFAYFAEWGIYDNAYFVNNIPVSKLTHILYAFMLPNLSQKDFDALKVGNTFVPVPYDPNVPEGTLVYFDKAAADKNLPALKQIKAANPNVKIGMSIGGWSLSLNFSTVCADPVKRSNLVKSTAQFIVQNGFDVCDVDWEFPGKLGASYNHFDPVNDPINFLNLIKELRVELNQQSPNKRTELTCATGCDPVVLDVYKPVYPFLDYILLMSYDFAGAFDPFSGHHAALYHNPADTNHPSSWCGDAAVKKTIADGCPSGKVALGAAAYGRGWGSITGGMFGNSTGTNQAAPTYSGTSGVPGSTQWRHLKDQISNGALKEFYDDIAHAYYAQRTTADGVRQVGELWTYDNVPSVKEKAQYVLDNNLAGIMLWSLEQDSRDSDRNLLDAIVSVFNSAPNTGTNTGTNSNTNTGTNTGSNTGTNTGTNTGSNTGTNTGNAIVSSIKVTITNTGSSNIVIPAGASITLSASF